MTNVQIDTTYSYLDLRFHYGLDTEKQNFKIFAFNNGNLPIIENNYLIYINRILLGLEKNNLFSEIKKIFKLNGGDIENKLNEDLDGRILPLFDSSDHQILEFEVFNSAKIKIYEMVLGFDSQNRKFVTNLGAGPQQPTWSKNYVELLRPYKSNYIIHVNEEIQVGESCFPFDILA